MSVIKIYRRRKKMTQKVLAQKCNVKQNYISQLENFKKVPTLNLINKLAKKLDICPIIIFINFYCNGCKHKDNCNCICKNFIENKCIKK